MNGSVVTVLALICTCVFSGCQTDALVRRAPLRGAPVTSLESVEIARQSDMSLAAAGEVDLVEQLIEHRTHYSQTLKQLGQYYQDHGHFEKHMWVRSELEDVERIRAYHYLLDSELPRLDLVPRDNNADANALYERAVAAAARAGHGLPVFFNQEKMGKALAMFKQLIRDYPTSDKIDDAAFYCGEIYKEYYKNEDTVSVKWYERAWTWDPATPHPARFQAAAVYDFRLHDRRRALELYRASIAAEPSRSNKSFAFARIKELTITGPVDGQRTYPVAKPSTRPPTSLSQKEPAVTANPRTTKTPSDGG